MKESTVRETYLSANSKKKAFYKLTIEKISDIGFLIRKESGIEGSKVLHSETYFREFLKDAVQLHNKKIKQKTNKNNKRDRVYEVVSDFENPKEFQKLIWMLKK